jgi:hypothetical protein
VKTWIIVAAVATSLTAGADALPAQTQPGAPVTTPGTQHNDYGTDASWLCRPGRHDACDIDLTTTIVNADGTTRRETFTADPNPPIDCFYVYPTVSTDPGTFSDMTPDPAERNVVAQQFARFSRVCRLFAPMYRQRTLAGLRAPRSSGESGIGAGTPIDDVRDAWRYYLEHDNRGRGVVLIGHSQGSSVLAPLIASEIDGKPVQSRLVSAILMGTSVAVPKGQDAGGTFQHIPVCRKASDTGCVITFSSYRSTIPPPENALFGRTSPTGVPSACSNPAALEGGSGELHAYLDAKGQTIVGTYPPAAWATGVTIDTPWVSVPGLLTAECKSNGHSTYLEITVHGNPADPRTDDITGDLGTGARLQPSWGLHLIDVNLTMGNLLDVVSQQARAFASKK